MRTAKAVPVFMYHHVSPSPGLVTVSPAIFRQQIAALATAGWRTAGLDELAAFFAGEEIPAKTCVITFDDGYLDNYVYAHPVLREFGMKAVLFIVSGWLSDGVVRVSDVETPSHSVCKAKIASGEADSVVLRWSEVELMSAAGTFEFHSHTHTHQRWDQLVADEAQRFTLLREDLLQSRAILEQRLGRVSQHLCWPQGYYDAQYQACATETGFKYLYTTEKKIVSRKTDSASIGRIVTKERNGDWIINRASWFSKPLLGSAYSLLNNVSLGNIFKKGNKGAGSGAPKGIL
jgi:peptidoglycan/xylan/chitin deacetylase (PgdA/CDA1 family)